MANKSEVLFSDVMRPADEYGAAVTFGEKVHHLVADLLSNTKTPAADRFEIDLFGDESDADQIERTARSLLTLAEYMRTQKAKKIASHPHQEA